MTIIEDLNVIKSQIDQLIQKYSSETPVDPSPGSTWNIPEQTLAGEPGYLNEPRLVRCLNGDIICFYRCGSGHISNGADIRYRRSVDKGITWSLPITLQSVPSRDCRNISVGITPTGRVIVINRTTNGSTTDKHWRHYSDDNCNSWTTEEFQSTLSSVAFGRILTSSKGLVRFSYLNNKIICEFSLDDGITWGNYKYAWNSSQVNATFSEPYGVSLDENRIVIVMRDNQDGGRYFWSKSADGGESWVSGPSASSARFTGNIVTPAAPASLCLKDNKVYMAWDARSPLWKGYYSKTDMEAFWNNPHHAWQSGVSDTQICHSSAIANGTASGGEFGYTDVISTDEGVISCWYDSKTGNGTTECKILIESIL